MADKTTLTELQDCINKSTQETEVLYQQWLKKQQIEPAIAIQLMRTMHTIKGLSQMANKNQAAAIAHTYETIIDNLVRHTITFNQPLINALVEAQRILMTITQAENEQPEQMVASLQQQLTSFLPTTMQQAAPKQPPASVTLDLTVLGLQLDDIETLRVTEKEFILHAWQDNQTIVSYVAHMPTASLETAVATLTQQLATDGSIITIVPTASKIPAFDYAMVFIMTSSQQPEVISKNLQYPGSLITVSAKTMPTTIAIKGSLQQPEPTPTPQKAPPKAEDVQITTPPPTATPPKQVVKTKQQATVASVSFDKLETLLWTTQKEAILHVPLTKIDTLINLYNKLISCKARIEKICQKIKANAPGLETAIALDEQLLKLDTYIRQSQQTLLATRLVNVESITGDLIRLVNRLAQEHGKQVTFTIQGDKTAVDKSLLDNLYNPLVHLLKNAVDHGINTPEERIKLGKPPQGTITLRFEEHDTTVTVSVADDGAGINVEAIKKKALESKLIDAVTCASLTDQQVYEFLFYPGFSTKTMVTQTSGRGVGMSAVKEAITKMHGTITIASQPGEGSTFTITIPSYLSLQRLLRFTVAKHHFALSFSTIEAIEPFKSDALQQHKDYFLYAWHNKPIRAFFLKQLLSLPDKPTDEEQTVLILKQSSLQLALIVDAVVGQEEIIVRPLPPAEQETFAFYAGHADFGDDKLVMVVHSDKLFEMVAHEPNKS